MVKYRYERAGKPPEYQQHNSYLPNGKKQIDKKKPKLIHLVFGMARLKAGMSRPEGLA